METLLPTEIVSNIFSRLPFDTVMQCKCVSKSWYNLLQLLIHTSGDLYFAKTHRGRLLENNNNLNFSSSPQPDSILLLFDQSVVDNYGQVCFGEYYNSNNENGYNFNKQQLVVKKFNSPVLFNMSSKFWTMASSSNGLICSAFHDDHQSSYLFYIYNPFLREYVTLPKLKKSASAESSNSMAFGFGYVPSTGEYKVVRIFYPSGSDNNSTVGNVEVYTLGEMSHTWTSKGSIQHRLKVSSPGVLVNGSLHWLTEKVLSNDQVKQLDIVAFDLLEEEFRSMPLPLPPSKHLINFQIKQFGGCLCAINDGGERIMEMWTMKNYHRKESSLSLWSWERVFCIQWGGGKTEQCFYWNKVDQALLWSNSSLICVDVDPSSGPKIEAGKDPISARLFHGIPHIKRVSFH